MNRERALARLLELRIPRKDALSLLAEAKRLGSTTGNGVTVGCHPVSGRYNVKRY